MDEPLLGQQLFHLLDLGVQDVYKRQDLGRGVSGGVRGRRAHRARA